MGNTNNLKLFLEQENHGLKQNSQHRVRTHMSEGEEPEFVLQLHYLGTVH